MREQDWVQGFVSLRLFIGDNNPSLIFVCEEGANQGTTPLGL
jgi:hypothetical protein